MNPTQLHEVPLTFTASQRQQMDQVLMRLADRIAAPLVMVADVSGRLVIYRGRLSSAQSTALAALAAGAESALSVDGSAPALELARLGAKIGGTEARFATRQGDAFDVMAALAQEGERFGLVVCDPPAFAPSKQALDAGLRAYERVARLAAPLVEEGGYLGLCSCSHAADLTRFRDACLRGIGRAGRRAQLLHTGFASPDHPQLPQLAESGYLKAVFFRL